MATEKRTPYDGKPYYCKLCGAGGTEFYHCEEPDCELETEVVAQARKAKHAETAK